MRPAPPSCAPRMHSSMRVRQVRPAGADVGAEHVRAVALVVHARGQRHGRDRRAGRRRRTCRRSGRRSAAGTPRDRRASRARGTCRPVCSNSVRRSSASEHPKRRATPGRYHTGSIAALVTTAVAGVAQDDAVRPQAPGLDRLADLGHVDVGLGDRDGRADVVALRQVLGVRPRPPRAPNGSSDTMRSGSNHCGCGPIAIGRARCW